MIFLQPTDQPDPVEPGHLEINQQQVRRHRPELAERFLAVLGADDLRPRLLEATGRHLPDHRLILSVKNHYAGQGPGGIPVLPAGCDPRGKAEAEGRSLTGCALHLQGRPHPGQDPLDDGEAQPDPVFPPLCLPLEAAELAQDAGDVRRCEPDPGVDDGQIERDAPSLLPFLADWRSAP